MRAMMETGFDAVYLILVLTLGGENGHLEKRAGTIPSVWRYGHCAGRG